MAGESSEYIQLIRRILSRLDATDEEAGKSFKRDYLRLYDADKPVTEIDMSSDYLLAMLVNFIFQYYVAPGYFLRGSFEYIINAAKRDISRIVVTEVLGEIKRTRFELNDDYSSRLAEIEHDFIKLVHQLLEVFPDLRKPLTGEKKVEDLFAYESPLARTQRDGAGMPLGSYFFSIMQGWDGFFSRHGDLLRSYRLNTNDGVAFELWVLSMLGSVFEDPLLSKAFRINRIHFSGGTLQIRRVRYGATVDPFFTGTLATGQTFRLFYTGIVPSLSGMTLVPDFSLYVERERRPLILFECKDRSHIYGNEIRNIVAYLVDSCPGRIHLISSNSEPSDYMERGFRSYGGQIARNQAPVRGNLSEIRSFRQELIGQLSTPQNIRDTEFRSMLYSLIMNQTRTLMSSGIILHRADFKLHFS